MDIHSFTITNNDTPDYINKNLNKRITILLEEENKMYLDEIIFKLKGSYLCVLLDEFGNEYWKLDEWQNVYYKYMFINEITYFEKGCCFNIFTPAQINTLTSFLLSGHSMKLEYCLTNSMLNIFTKSPYKIIID